MLQAGGDCKSRGHPRCKEEILRRGMPSKTSYSLKPSLASCYRFKIKGNTFSFPIGEGRTFGILLTQHTLRVLSDTNLKVRSFVLTSSTISLCISKEVPIVECIDTAGVGRKLLDLTCWNEQSINPDHPS